MRRIISPVNTDNTPSLATSTTVAAATARRGFQIQNQDTNPLYILLGTGASSSVYHFVLKGGTGAHDGNGGSFAQNVGAVWQGAISCYSAGTPSYTYLELY